MMQRDTNTLSTLCASSIMKMLGFSGNLIGEAAHPGRRAGAGAGRADDHHCQRGDHHAEPERGNHELGELALRHGDGRAGLPEHPQRLQPRRQPDDNVAGSPRRQARRAGCPVAGARQATGQRRDCGFRVLIETSLDRTVYLTVESRGAHG